MANIDIQIVVPDEDLERVKRALSNAWGVDSDGITAHLKNEMIGMMKGAVEEVERREAIAAISIRIVSLT